MSFALLNYRSFRGLAFMQEKYRTDFCLMGYGISVLFIDLY